MYIIQTERLGLREYIDADLDALYDIISDPETMKYYTSPYDRKGAERWLKWCMDSYRERGFGLWAVELRATGEFIGDCGISMQNIDGAELPEIGYHIAKSHWRQGYAREAARAVRDWGFENTGFDALYSYMNSANVPSYSTARSNGMRRISVYTAPNGIEHAVYRITREEWLRLR